MGLMASRRAYADEFAVRVNRAVVLLADRSPADAVRGLEAEFGLSERQGRRYVNEALAPSLIAGLRERARASGVSLSAATAAAVVGYLDQAGERPGGPAR
jgi:hypothetical protein